MAETLNDSLTSFRIVAVAASAEGLFGSGHTSVRTTQDLMLHSGLPAIVREGDRFQGMFTLRNASERPIAFAASARVSPQPDPDAAVDLPEQSLDLEPGQAREVHWEYSASAGADGLIWEVFGRQREGGASDRIRVAQKVIPVHPVRIYQATLTQMEAPLSMSSERPKDAVAGRGGIRVALRGRIGDGLSGVREYMQRYPYTCLEQRISKAIALRDPKSLGYGHERSAELPRRGWLAKVFRQRFTSKPQFAFRGASHTGGSRWRWRSLCRR